MADYWDHPEYTALEERCGELETACKKMLEVTGGSKHWNGGTHEALKMIESALGSGAQPEQADD